MLAAPAVLAQAPVERGKYLVTIAGCNDCHTPGYFFGKPDKARFLGGSEVGFRSSRARHLMVPTSRLTRPASNWTSAQVLAALQIGVRPDGRLLAPIMPWHAYASLSQSDASAIVAFLRSLPPVKNKVPGPFGPTDKPTSFVMKIVPRRRPAK